MKPKLKWLFGKRVSVSLRRITCGRFPVEARIENTHQYASLYGRVWHWHVNIIFWKIADWAKLVKSA